MAKSVLEALAQVMNESKPVMPEAPQVAAPETWEERWKTLKALEKDLNKQFNTTSSLVRLGSKSGQLMPSISTGLYTFDFDVVGTGGIPRGRIIEFLGPESSGKTTAALHIVGEEQHRSAICAYIDAEHALDPSYAKKLGVDIDNLVVSQPESGEEALETVDALVDSRAVSLIVVDSVAALVPRAELDGEMGESHMGLQARLMSQAMRKLRGKCNRNGVTVIFINQIREKIGVIYGSPETTSGGRALRFYASVRVDIRRTTEIKDGTTVIGHKVRLKAIKNKVGSPKRETEIDLIYGVGFDKMADLVEYAVIVGVVERSGGWLKFDGLSFRKDDLSSSPELLEKIKVELVKAQEAQRKADNDLQQEPK